MSSHQDRPFESNYGSVRNREEMPADSSEFGFPHYGETEIQPPDPIPYNTILFFDSPCVNHPPPSETYNSLRLSNGDLPPYIAYYQGHSIRLECYQCFFRTPEENSACFIAEENTSMPSQPESASQETSSDGGLDQRDIGRTSNTRPVVETSGNEESNGPMDMESHNSNQKRKFKCKLGCGETFTRGDNAKRHIVTGVCQNV
ncbi:hypothetical protein RUND412_001622 [Rhizina undulata]